METWEVEAWQRIDAHRKRDLAIKVLSTTGDPVPGAEVNVTLKRHEFDWGAVIKAVLMEESTYRDTYKELYLKYFNAAGFENALKPKHRESRISGLAENAIIWFRDNDFKMRGHAFVWEGENWLHRDALAIYQDPALTDLEKGNQIKAEFEKHIDWALPKWEVEWWDVVNEPIVNDLVNNLLPNENTFVHWFQLAKEQRDAIDKDFALVLNENQVISANRNNTQQKPVEFKQLVVDLMEEGAPIEMLGFQARIRNGLLSPETMYERLQLFEDLNLPYQATEFEVRDNFEGEIYTPEMMKRQTEETMIIYFSHPNVVGFWHWTFAVPEDGGFHWALFNYDGTPRPTGEKWIEMMEGKFNTDTTMLTPSSGTSNVRGYKGEYEITVSFGEQTITAELTLDEDKELVLNAPFEFEPEPQPLSVEDDLMDNILVGVNYEKSTFSILGDEPVSYIFLYSLSGNKVRSYVGATGHDISTISPGVYLVWIALENHMIVGRKLIVR